MDLRSDPDQPYVYAEQLRGSRVNTANHNHRQEYGQLKKWSPLALAKGIVWLNWNVNQSPMATICHGEFDGSADIHQQFGVALAGGPGVRPEEAGT